MNNPFDRLRDNIDLIERQAYDEIEEEMFNVMIQPANWHNRTDIIDRYERQWRVAVIDRLRRLRQCPEPPATTVGDATLPTALGELTDEYLSSDDDEDALPIKSVEKEEIDEIYSEVAYSTREVIGRDIRTITTKWPIKRWERDIQGVLAEMEKHYTEETFRKRATTMWRIAKYRKLDCTETLEAVKQRANYKAITNRAQGINNGHITKLEYGQIVQAIMDRNVPLSESTLFLVGLPARRVADIEALWVIDSPFASSELAGNTDRNYLIVDRENIGKSRLVWTVQKVDKECGYRLFDLTFLPNYAEICAIVRHLPSGKFTNNNYYENTLKATGFTPTNFRHYWFDHGKKHFPHAQWMFIIKCMNSSMAQAVTYCS